MTGTSVSISSSAEETLVCQLAFPVSKPLIRYYDGQGGGTLANIPADTAPFTAAQLLVNGLVAPIPVNRADNYSARSRGYIRPTVTGTYTIWVSSDDAGFFSLGAANASTCGLATSVSNAGYSGAQGATGASFTVALTAGVAYPYEMGYSEGAGGDYIQIDWSVGGSARAVIPAAVIFAENPNSLAKRQLTKVSAGGVDTYTAFDGAIVVPTAAQPLVDCGTDYNFNCGSGGAPLAVTVPAADGVIDTRIGSAGVAITAARADHVHPIVRLAQVVLPPFVLTNAALNGLNVYRQSTTEETQTFQVQLVMTPTALNNWKTVAFPNIPGYFLEAVTFNGIYRGQGPNVAFSGQAFMYQGTFYLNQQTAVQHFIDFTLHYRLN